MGKNTGDGQRIGAQIDRVQYYNPKTDMYVKMDTETKKFMSCKKNPYKGVRNKSKDSKDGKNKSDDKSEKATKTKKTESDKQ